MLFSFPTARLKKAQGWSCWEAHLKKKGKAKGTGLGWYEEQCNTNRGNNPVKKQLLNKTEDSANKNMYPSLEAVTSILHI